MTKRLLRSNFKKNLDRIPNYDELSEASSNFSFENKKMNNSIEIEEEEEFGNKEFLVENKTFFNLPPKLQTEYFKNFESNSYNKKAFIRCYKNENEYHDIKIELDSLSPEFKPNQDKAFVYPAKHGKAYTFEELKSILPVGYTDFKVNTSPSGQGTFKSVTKFTLQESREIKKAKQEKKKLGEKRTTLDDDGSTNEGVITAAAEPPPKKQFINIPQPVLLNLKENFNYLFEPRDIQIVDPRKAEINIVTNAIYKYKPGLYSGKELAVFIHFADSSYTLVRAYPSARIPDHWEFQYPNSPDWNSLILTELDYFTVNGIKQIALLGESSCFEILEKLKVQNALEMIENLAKELAYIKQELPGQLPDLKIKIEEKIYKIF